MNRLYPIGIQNFEKLRKGGFVYVDKTALIHRRLYIVLSLQAVIISSVVLAVLARV